MTRNQDDEYNTRLRRNGGKIWLTDEAAVAYYPRSTLRRLADQYRQYGHWRLVGTVVFGNQLRARQLAPAVLVATSLLSLVAAGRGARRLPFAIGTAYLGLLGAQVSDARRRGHSWRAATTSAAAVATMHWAYGLGFWQGAWTALTRRAALRQLTSTTVRP
jgi:succinoglycan biosynthesis protein ExoA